MRKGKPTISVLVVSSGEYEEYRQRIVAVYLHDDMASEAAESFNKAVLVAREKYTEAIEADNDRWQERIRNTLRRKVGDNEIEYSDIRDLKYDVILVPFF